MIKAWILRLHRWVALVFALPLAIVMLSGLVLSVEPILQTRPVAPGLLTLERLHALLDEHDPAGAAKRLTVIPHERRLVLRGVGPDGELEIDVASGEVMEEEGAWSTLFGTMRGLHKKLLLDMKEVVIASTIALLALMVLGLCMGWMRLRPSVSGVHRGLAWLGLPLLLAPPVTGLLIVMGLSFSAPAPKLPREPALSLREGLAVIGAHADMSTVLQVRQRRGALQARLNEGGEYRHYAVTRSGLVALPRQWPKLIHEATWAGLWSGLLNMLTIVGFLGLMGTGLTIWARRRFRRRQRSRPGMALAGQT